MIVPKKLKYIHRSSIMTSKHPKAPNYTVTHLLRYRFICVRSKTTTRYDICVTLDDENLTLTLPFPDRNDAYEAYLLIKRGLVTPTTLSDVIADMEN